MLGDRLTKLRKEKKLTQNEIAEKLHIHRSTYAQYEVDRRVPEYATLEKLANFFQVSIDYLVGRTNDPTHIMSEEARVFVDDLNLSDEEFIKKHNIIVDGIPLTEEQIKKFLVYVRVERAQGLDKTDN